MTKRRGNKAIPRAGNNKKGPGRIPQEQPRVMTATTMRRRGRSKA
jgi:hypothetical protein